MRRRHEPLGDVYLLHFDSPIAPGIHTCQHYIGWAEDVFKRLEEHAAGRGARLTEVAKERGITFRLARVWPGETRSFERRLKNWKMGPRLCPICIARRAESKLREAA